MEDINFCRKARKRRSGMKYNTSRKYEKMRSDANLIVENLRKQKETDNDEFKFILGDSTGFLPNGEELFNVNETPMDCYSDYNSTGLDDIYVHENCYDVQSYDVEIPIDNNFLNDDGGSNELEEVVEEEEVVVVVEEEEEEEEEDEVLVILEKAICWTRNRKHQL